ncbi:MAG: nucleotidyltransferase domain-containing protein [Alphaproteobacteria bacterium]|nr:nucleotidyltransferase domain-containing protein [Alphaproteobacteria bacterium]
MLADIENRRTELSALCRRFHVRRLDLFGSAARADFDPTRSDIDFLVEFDRGHPDAFSLATYFGLKESLEALFGRPVDLVEPRAVENPYLKASIEHSREPVFAA